MQRDPKRLWEYTKLMLQITMGLLYIVIGIYIIKDQWFMTALEKAVSYPLGGLLIAYGLFRIYRITKN
ncbi:MAG: hypothetical protein ACI9IP_001963 [Arcticibacterium sp.]|jgi:hypothetical protein